MWRELRLGLWHLFLPQNGMVRGTRGDPLAERLIGPISTSSVHCRTSRTTTISSNRPGHTAPTRMATSLLAQQRLLHPLQTIPPVRYGNKAAVRPTIFPRDLTTPTAPRPTGTDYLLHEKHLTPAPLHASIPILTGAASHHLQSTGLGLFLQSRGRW